MPTDWRSPCGVPYRLHEDGRIEVQNYGFPAWQDAVRHDQIAKLWQRWGADIERAAIANGIPAAWLVGIMYIETGGNPTLCSSAGACGLMQFMPFTCKMFRPDCSHYNAFPQDQILDAGKLINQLRAAKGGCLLSAVKGYNGGSPCSDTGMTNGPGILNMYGQHDYVANFVRAANTFVGMNLPSTTGIMGGGSVPASTQVIVVAGILGAVAYMFADIHYGLTNRALDAYARRFA